jgi:hypothetical protein
MSNLASAAGLLQSITSRWSTAANTVVYTRGSTSVIWANVSLGKSALASDETTEARIEDESADFIGPAVGIVPIFGVPQQGDRIALTLANTSRTYELMSPPYRPSDSAGVNIRCHGKLATVY